MDLGDHKIKVQRASIGFTQASGLEMGVNAMSMFAGTTSDNFEDGRVLQLLNMVTAEELIDNEDYEGELLHMSILLCLSIPLTSFRNRRRRDGRMPEIWQNRRIEDTSSFRRQPTICWSGQDFHQVRHCRISQEGSTSPCWQEICRSNCRYDVF